MENSDKIKEYVDNNPYLIYIDYRDELTRYDVERILAGEEDRVREDLSLDYYDNGEYIHQVVEAIDVPEDEVARWIDANYEPVIELSDWDWHKLLRNTPVLISARIIDASLNLSPIANGGKTHYSEMRETFKLLGIDPYQFRDLVTDGNKDAGMFDGWFPITKRSPKVDVHDFVNNIGSYYDGILHFMLDDLEQVAELIRDNPKEVTFKAGTHLVMYDRMSGAGVTDTVLTEDVEIFRNDIEFDNDGVNSYGIQSCYGFVESEWGKGGMIW